MWTIPSQSDPARSLLPMEQLGPHQILDVRLKFVPQIAFGEPKKIRPRQIPHSQMTQVFRRWVFLAWTRGIDNLRAAHRRHDIGECYVIAARRLYHQSAEECVPGSLPNIVAERWSIAQILMQGGGRARLNAVGHQSAGEG